jgi:hypothetical protein
MIGNKRTQSVRKNTNALFWRSLDRTGFAWMLSDLTMCPTIVGNKKACHFAFGSGMESAII